MSRELRVAVIGAGMMGADHAQRVALRTSGAHLELVCDVDRDRAAAVAASVGGCRILDDPAAAINDPEVDAAVIVTPGPFHQGLLEAALKRQLPVLCEKPLTPEAETSLAIVEAEAAIGRRLVQVGFMRRFDPQYKLLKATVDGGSMGRLLLFHCVHRAPSVPDTFTEDMLINDAVVHEFDVVRWLVGEEIERVWVVAPRSGSSLASGGSSPQIVQFETTSGVYVDVEINVNCQFGYQVRCEGVFESGTLAIGDNTGPVRQHRGAWGGEISSDFRFRFAQAYDQELQTWVDSVAAGTPAGPSAWDGYAAAAVSEAAIRAQSAHGEPLEVKLAPMPALYR
ncbi:MAG: Gfo/Idh/MocA family oxidoreductase [Nitrospiraceae bacterium]|nr:Gfo/Idh/MocA family oxidoreductase [Nitrospiraceae bacterium]